MIDKYTVNEVANSWEVVGGKKCIVSFWKDGTPDREQDARNYAAELNSREPKIELPTGPGWYLDKDGDICSLDRHGNWWGQYGAPHPRPEELAPFTRLYSESEVRELRAQAVESVGSFAHQHNTGLSLGWLFLNRAAEIRGEGQA
jgi:hypothetical protein